MSERYTLDLGEGSNMFKYSPKIVEMDGSTGFYGYMKDLLIVSPPVKSSKQTSHGLGHWSLMYKGWFMMGHFMLS